MRQSRLKTRRQSRIGAVISSLTMGFTRASSANLDGVSYGNDVPRFPSNSGIRGVLVEESDTNLATYSDPTGLNATNFPTNSGAGNLTYIAGGIPGFSGCIQFSRGASTVYTNKQNAVTSGLAYTVSVYLVMDDGGAPVVGATSGAVDLSLNFNGNYIFPVTVTDLGGGLYRASGTVTSGVTATVNWGVAKYTSQTARGFKVTGYQFEQKGYVTSYMATAAASVSRAAETLTVPTAGLLVPSQGSVIIQFTVPFINASGAVVVDLGGSGTTGLFGVITGTGKLRLSCGDGTALRIAESTSTLVAGQTYIGVLRWRPTGTSVTLLGAVQGTYNAAVSPALLANARIGALNTGSLFLNGLAHMMATYTRYISDAEAVAASVSLAGMPADFTAYLDFTTGQLQTKLGHPWKTAELIHLLLDRSA